MLPKGGKHQHILKYNTCVVLTYIHEKLYFKHPQLQFTTRER